MVRLAVLHGGDRRLLRSTAKASVVVLRCIQRAISQWSLSITQNQKTALVTSMTKVGW